MAILDVTANAGGKDLPFITGNVKVSLITQTAAVSANSQVSPKGINRVIGVICSQGALTGAMSGYTGTSYSESAEDQVSITGGADAPGVYLIFGY